MTEAEALEMWSELSAMVECAVELGDQAEADRLNRRLDGIKARLQALDEEA
jgi:hypothetical protein